MDSNFLALNSAVLCSTTVTQAPSVVPHSGQHSDVTVTQQCCTLQYSRPTSTVRCTTQQSAQQCHSHSTVLYSAVLLSHKPCSLYHTAVSTAMSQSLNSAVLCSTAVPQAPFIVPHSGQHSDVTVTQQCCTLQYCCHTSTVSCTTQQSAQQCHSLSATSTFGRQPASVMWRH